MDKANGTEAPVNDIVSHNQPTIDDVIVDLFVRFILPLLIGLALVKLFWMLKEHILKPQTPQSNSAGIPMDMVVHKKTHKMAGGSTPIASASSRSASSESREVALRLWRTGFTIDDGQLRLYSDPENLAFLEILDSMKTAEIRRELIRSHPGQEVQLAMEDRRHEQFEPPKAPRNPLSGQGHMIGTPAPAVVPAAASTTASDRTTEEEAARNQINLSEGDPTTNLQFRLADGTRLVARFNQVLPASITFYEGDQDQSDHEVESDLAVPTSVAPQLLGADVPSAPKSTVSNIPRTGNNTTLGLGTLDALRKQDEEADSSDEEKGQAFSAGGSVTSGQQVLGPPSKKKDEFIKDLLKKTQDEIPRELIRSHRGHEVQLAMEDGRHEQFEPPKAPRNPFSGQGHMLGSPAPAVVTASASTTASDRTAQEEVARNQINLSEGDPTTNLQFRLTDGTRLVARFNHTHRISDLHNFINIARPQYGSVNYILTLFPNRDLTDMELTLKDANVLNAALTQKVKSSA